MNANIRECKKIGKWLIDGDTGQSSLSLAAVFLGGKPSRVYTPSDSSDFNRCYMFLLDCVYPSNRLNLIWEMAELSEGWKKIRDNWFDLEKLWKEECKPGWLSAPKLYKKMQDLKV